MTWVDITDIVTGEPITASKNNQIIHNIEHLKDTNLTRELFLPAYGHTTDVHTNKERFHAMKFSDETSFNGYFTLKVPNDFISFTKIEAVWICAAASGNLLWLFHACYGASGEADDTHLDSPAAGTTATGGSDIINTQQSTNPLTLPALAMGDYVGIRFERQATSANDTLNADVYLLGLLFTYMANKWVVE